MPKRTKLPYNPNPPIYGNLPELSLPDKIFSGCQPSKYSSQYFSDQDTVDCFRRKIYPQVRVNGKGAVLFPDEEQFLSELDDALLHFDMFRGCFIDTGEHSLNVQRRYFKALNETASKLNDLLCGMSELHATRLAHAGIELRQYTEKRHSSHDLHANVAELMTATEKVRAGLKGKNSGRFAELYLLTELLGQMYQSCSGRAPSHTDNQHNQDSKGVFFVLIKSVIPLVNLQNKKSIMDSSITEG